MVPVSPKLEGQLNLYLILLSQMPPIGVLPLGYLENFVRIGRMRNSRAYQRPHRRLGVFGDKTCESPSRHEDCVSRPRFVKTPNKGERHQRRG